MTQHPTRRTVLDSATALAGGSLVTGGALGQSDQQSAASTTADDPGFVRVEDGQFVRDGEPYRAIAGTTYGMMWNGLDYITQMVKSAKANGLRQLRATVIFSQLHNGGVDDPAIITEEKAHINDETIWTRIDWLLKEARDHDMTVLFETGDFIQLLWKAGMDPYTEENRELHYEHLDHVLNRENQFMGVTYKEDPTIFAWAPIVENQAFGRDQEDCDRCIYAGELIDLARDLSSYIQKNDPNHIVSTGSMLHMEGKNREGEFFDYWKKVYDDPNTDVAGSHVYPRPITGEWPVGDWKNLEKYVEYAQGLDPAKPFAVQEFGANRDRYEYEEVLSYFENVFDEMRGTVPQAVVWNWAPGANFEVYPNTNDGVVEIIRENARDWGFEGEFTDYDIPEVTTDTLVTDFSAAGDWTGDAASLSEERSTVGEQALKIEMDVEDPWVSEAVVEVEESIDLSGHDYLAMDMGIEDGYESLGAFPAIELTSSEGTTYISENATSVQNRLFDGQWRTVYWSLSDDDFQWDETDAPGDVTIEKLTLSLAHTSAPFTGSVFVDNVRLGELVHEDDPLGNEKSGDGAAGESGDSEGDDSQARIDESEEEDDSVPGFEITTALASAGGATYLLKRHRQDTDGDGN